MADHDGGGSFDEGVSVTRHGVSVTWRAGLDLWTYQFLHYGYGVAPEPSTHRNSAISHTGEGITASIRRGLTPILFFYVARSPRLGVIQNPSLGPVGAYAFFCLVGAKPTVRGGRDCDHRSLFQKKE